MILPKPHLSYSQMQIWQSNPDRYRREYFENLDKLDTAALRFGKCHAENREKRQLLPGQFTEFEIKIEINGVPILSYLDFYDSNNNIFEDDKTGKIPWTQAKLQKSEQMLFYATALKHLTGNMPEYCVINWFETTDQGEEGGLQNDINFTGKEKSFTRHFHESEISRMEQLIVKCANEISEAYKLWLNDI